MKVIPIDELKSILDSLKDKYHQQLKFFDTNSNLHGIYTSAIDTIEEIKTEVEEWVENHER